MCKIEFEPCSQADAQEHIESIIWSLQEIAAELLDEVDDEENDYDFATCGQCGDCSNCHLTGGPCDVCGRE